MHDRNAGSSIYPAKTKNVSFSMFVIAPVERKQKVSFLFSCHNFISYPGSLDPPPPSPFSLPSLVVRPCTCILGEYSRWRGGCRAIKRKKNQRRYPGEREHSPPLRTFSSFPLLPAAKTRAFSFIPELYVPGAGFLGDPSLIDSLLTDSITPGYRLCDYDPIRSNYRFVPRAASCDSD